MSNMREMHRVAAIILNRNLPALTDELGDWILSNNKDIVDLYVVENGSRQELYSKYANISFQESYGPARGINEGLKIVMQNTTYTHVWVNFNDARYLNESFLRWALHTFERIPQVGIITGWWEGNVWPYGTYGDVVVLNAFSALGFIVSRKALEACLRNPLLAFDPLWDSTNFANHGNIYATSIALADAGMLTISHPSYPMYEKRDAADTASALARGYDDTTWKHVVGPESTKQWIDRVFPGVRGGMKGLRSFAIRYVSGKLRHMPLDIKASRKSSFVSSFVRNIVS